MRQKKTISISKTVRENDNSIQCLLKLIHLIRAITIERTHVNGRLAHNNGLLTWVYFVFYNNKREPDAIVAMLIISAIKTSETRPRVELSV